MNVKKATLKWVYSKSRREIENLVGISLSFEQLCSTDRQMRFVASGVKMQEDASAFDVDREEVLLNVIV